VGALAGERLGRAARPSARLTSRRQAAGALWWAQRDTGPGPEFVTADGELAVVDGVLTFTPAPGYSGRSEVMYTVSDAEGLVSAPVLVTLRVSEPG